MQLGGHPIRQVTEHSLSPLDRATWPATLPPVRQLLDQGLELGQATVFVGANGAGKSTIVEAIALAFGLSAEGGSTGARHTTRASESPLWDHLQLVRNAGASKRGYFLRAETMHSFFTYLEQNPGGRAEPVFHERSHGESFLDLVFDRFEGAGLFVLDEPESALSFSGCLSLITALREQLANPGAQVILSTHSPLLAALPGAVIYEVGEWGLRQAAWDDLDLVQSWRAFLARPHLFLDS